MRDLEPGGLQVEITSPSLDAFSPLLFHTILQDNRQSLLLFPSSTYSLSQR